MVPGVADRSGAATGVTNQSGSVRNQTCGATALRLWHLRGSPPAAAEDPVGKGFADQADQEVHTMSRPRIPARPTIYNGIQMRSRLEAGFAAWLDERGATWEYEPHAFASPSGQYLPDFLVRDVVRANREPADAYIEIKPRAPYRETYLGEVIRRQPEDEELAQIARQMEIVWESHEDVELLLVWPGLLVHDRLPAAFRLSRIAADSVDVVGASALFRPTLWMHRLSHPGLAIGEPIPPGLAPWPDGYWQVQ